jgi:hypothetical protein
MTKRFYPAESTIKGLKSKPSLRILPESDVIPDLDNVGPRPNGTYGFTGRLGDIVFSDDTTILS